MNIFGKKSRNMDLEEVTKLLSELRLPTALVFTPTNLEGEKKKFFNSDTYEPQFEYRIVRNKNKEILKDLLTITSISDVDPRISEFYIDLIESKNEANQLMNVVGDNSAFTDISVKRYGKPNSKLFRNACRVLRGNVDAYNLVRESGSKKSELLGYEEIENIFNIVFKELGLEGWGVSKSMNIAKNGVKVGVKTKQVLVDGNIQRSKLKLRKTLVHEVGTHVLRAHNGLSCGFEAFSKPNLPDYLDVEEGLATWNEYSMGLLTKSWLMKKVAFIYAIYLGEELSFRELYNSLLAVLPKYASFDVAYRVKRGMSDTSMQGIYSKDIVYFRGFRKVLRRLEENPSLYAQLYAGKIGFKQCDWVEEGLLRKPIIVPSKEKWLEIFKKVKI